MVKFVRDATGRFAQRPFYTQQELDLEFDQVIRDFMQEKYGSVVFPIPTDALTTLVERDAADLDLYADLRSEGPAVEGVTTFYAGRKPRVRIARDLSDDEGREHRLRTTLTHEYGHVRLHRFLWEMERQVPGLFAASGRTGDLSCRRDTLLDAPQVDWLEWQAGYACGALLMPVSEMRSIVSAAYIELGLYGPITIETSPARDLIQRVAIHFDVSPLAARVRLTKLGHLTTDEQPLPLFP